MKFPSTANLRRCLNFPQEFGISDMRFFESSRLARNLQLIKSAGTSFIILLLKNVVEIIFAILPQIKRSQSSHFRDALWKFDEFIIRNPKRNKRQISKLVGQFFDSILTQIDCIELSVTEFCWNGGQLIVDRPKRFDVFPAARIWKLDQFVSSYINPFKHRKSFRRETHKLISRQIDFQQFFQFSKRARDLFDLIIFQIESLKMHKFAEKRRNAF